MSIISISGKIGAGKDEVAKIIQRATNYYFEIRRFADNLKDIVCILIGYTREQLEDREFKEKELGEEWWYWYMERDGGYSPIILDYLTTTKKELKSYEGLELIKPTPRFLLQFIGTDLLRNQLHPEIWVNSLMSEYKEDTGYKYSVSLVDKTNKELDSDLQPGIEGISFKIKLEENPKLFNNGFPNWVIPDVRFSNELKAVKDRGGITIRVNRPDFMENALTGEKFPVKVYKKEHPSETSLDNAEFDYVIDNSGSLGDLEEKVLEILRKEKLI